MFVTNILVAFLAPLYCGSLPAMKALYLLTLQWLIPHQIMSSLHIHRRKRIMMTAGKQCDSGASPRSFVWGDGFIGTQTHLPPKCSFSSDFSYFIWKMVENAKLSCVKKKGTEISSFLGGRPPLIFRLRGTRPPVPRFRRPWCMIGKLKQILFT